MTDSTVPFGAPPAWEEMADEARRIEIVEAQRANPKLTEAEIRAAYDRRRAARIAEMKREARTHRETDKLVAELRARHGRSVRH